MTDIGSGASVRRTEWIDWYVADDESAVFVDGNVVVVSALATEALTAIDGWTGLDAVGDALVEAFGQPEDGDVATAVAEIVDQLVTSGVLERSA